MPPQICQKLQQDQQQRLQQLQPQRYLQSEPQEDSCSQVQFQDLMSKCILLKLVKP